MEGQFISLQNLGTFSGAVFAVTLVCQFLKGYADKVMKLPTRFMSLLVSWIVLLGHQYVTTGHLAFTDVFLNLLNGFLVALAAMGAHSVAKDNLQWK